MNHYYRQYKEKNILKFNDGVEFNTDGPLRIEKRYDGLYVVGKGMLIPINTREEGNKLIKRLGGNNE